MMEKEDYTLAVRCACGASFDAAGPHWPYLEAWMSKTVTEHLANCRWLSPVIVPAGTS